ncbi:MAG: NAD(P)-dependent oxidoreductase [Lachnospiraceae bacterium]|nr:NAD(P)-dependent oxidoreductase [Lachnospiraceae bacterium]
MNVLLIGGCGSLINNLIVKFKKEGHRVYLITGSRYNNAPYQRVFEKYNFPYDASCLKEIFESVKADVTIYLGAFDTNYKWDNEEAQAVQYSSGLMNILMSHSMNTSGKFIYLSSEEVFGLGSENNLTEYDEKTSATVKGMVFAQAEEMCESYKSYKNLDLITLRMDHLFTFPKKRSEAVDICAKMCLEALEQNTITINPNNSFSLLYESDAVQFIYNVAKAKKHKFSLYNVSSNKETDEKTLAEIVAKHMDSPIAIITKPTPGVRLVLSSRLFESEFGNNTICNLDAVIQKITSYMQKNRYIFLNDLDKKPPFYQRFLDKAGWVIHAIIPFMENLVAFIPFFMLNNRAVGSQYFANLDFYLLYVLLFAIVYGQQQAIFSAVLAVIGYIFRQMYDRTGFEVLLDSNTYVWIAQLFIVGMAVGYLRDQIKKLKKESVDEKDFLSLQLHDIQDINTTNVRVKDALETQIVNQNDSVGKIYKITSTLDQYSPEEVLFYAAEMVSNLVKSRDVAIYVVSNSQFARLFSATSDKARTFGNSLRYGELGEMYESIKNKEVYINRSLDEKYPMMANAIFDDEDRIQIIVMVWTMPWENMTLGQSNQLVIISALIKNAVIRSSRYLDALAEKRYVEGTKILAKEAFEDLMKAYLNAEREGLAECVLLRIAESEESYAELGARLERLLRESDIMGLMEDGRLYVLLSNTQMNDSVYAINRMHENGIECEYVEDGVRCLRTEEI